MDEKIIAIYCLCADVLDAIGHAEDLHHQMSDAEVIRRAWSPWCSFAATLKPRVPS